MRCQYHSGKLNSYKCETIHPCLNATFGANILLGMAMERFASDGVDAAGSKAVERVTAIIGILAEEGRSLGVLEISEAIGLPQATVHRFLKALGATGWVEKDPATARYRIGYGLLGPAVAALTHSDLIENAQPILNAGLEAGGPGTNCLLGVLVGRTVAFIARASRDIEKSPAPLTGPGLSRPAHTSASGKLLLAYTDSETRHRLCCGRPLRAYTANTITDPAALESELAKIRQQGYAIEEGEFREYLRGVAVPVHDGAGKVIAALTCGGRTELVTPEHLDEVRHELSHLAEDLSSAAGFRE